MLLAVLALVRPATTEAVAAEPTLRVEPVEQLAAAQGLVVERQRWYLDAGSGWVWRARVPLPVQLRVAAAATVRPFQDFLPEDSGPWVAINGGFYDVDGTAMGLVVADGQVAAPTDSAAGQGSSSCATGICASCTAANTSPAPSKPCNPSIASSPVGARWWAGAQALAAPPVPSWRYPIDPFGSC